MIKKIALLFLLTLNALLFSQENKFSNYKYIIVPEKFDFLSEPDQYQTSSLTKFLLEKKGFSVYLSNEVLPEELAKNKCLGLIAEVKNESNMFTIKNAIEIKDCYNTVVYTSKTGKSKIKEYQKGYQEAIRNAFNTMTDFEYSYTPNNNKGVDKTLIAEKTNKKDVIKVDDKKQIPITKKDTSEVKKELHIKSLPMLYAQEITLGYQLINKKPEVVFVILKTSKPAFFIIENKNGILYRKDTNWVAEYYQDNQLIKKEFTIKF